MGIPEELKAIAIERRSMESGLWSQENKYKDIQRCFGNPRTCGVGIWRDYKDYQAGKKTEAEFHRSYPEIGKTVARINQLKIDIEASKVREQGLIDKWNAEKMELADASLRKELATEEAKLHRAERKAQARGGHPEYGLSVTYRPPARRAKSGVRSRYAAPKRRSAPRPRPRPRPQGRR